MTERHKSYRPIIAQSPKGQVQAMLIPVIDDLSRAGASNITIQVWTETTSRPHIAHCMITAIYSDRRRSMLTEHGYLRRELAELGFVVVAPQIADISRRDIRVLASIPIMKIGPCYRVCPVTSRLSQLSGTKRRPSRNDKLIKKLEAGFGNAHKLQHMRPS